MDNVMKTPRSVGSIFMDGFKLYGRSFLHLFPITLLLALTILLPGILFYVERNLFGMQTFHLFFKILNIVFLILVPFILLWFGAVLLHQSKEVFTYSGITYRESFKFTLRKFPIYLVAGLVNSVVVTVSLMLLVFPGIFLYVLFGLYLFCILFDNDDVIASFKHSSQLIWGNWWRSFVIFFVVFLADAFLPFLANVSLIFHHYTPNMLIGIHTAISILLVVFIVPWAVVVLFSFYSDLKLRSNQ